MSEKKFQSKKEILEYLGKSPNDRKLVDRLVAKGEIEKTDEGYKLVQKEDGELEKLRAENEELKKKVEELELDKEIRESNEVNEAEYKEARVQRLYYADEYEKEKKDKEFRIRKCFQWIKARNPKANWEEFRERVMSNDE